MRINFCGPVLTHSGYAEFSRYFIAALHNAGHSVSVEPIMLDPNKLDYGNKGTLISSLIKVRQAPEINIINMIPPMFKQFRKKGCKNVGFTMFEADRIPSNWVKDCNDMDAIFVPCHHNRDIFLSSGVSVPIFVVSPGVEGVPPEVSNPSNAEEFRLYSIFQWIERKNPEGLIRAYASAFSGNEKVSLTIKTYAGTKTADNKSFIQNQVNDILKKIKLSHIPKINIITDFLSHDDMQKMHRDNHCYVSLARAEGWAIPAWDAVLHGNPVIHTGYSSINDFMEGNGVVEDSLATTGLIKYTMSPVYNTSSFVPFYDSSMMWADADLEHAILLMRSAHQNFSLWKDFAVKRRHQVVKDFSENNVISIMNNALVQVKGV